jgi:hypothetical protein
MRGYAPVSAFAGEKAKPSFLQRRRNPLILLLVSSIPALAFLAYLGQDRIPLLSSWSSTVLDTEGNGWDYVDEVGREYETQRLSWGALEQQGAKRSIRTNLRGDKGYLLSMYGAG